MLLGGQGESDSLKVTTFPLLQNPSPIEQSNRLRLDGPLLKEAPPPTRITRCLSQGQGHMTERQKGAAGKLQWALITFPCARQLGESALQDYRSTSPRLTDPEGSRPGRTSMTTGEGATMTPQLPTNLQGRFSDSSSSTTTGMLRLVVQRHPKATVTQAPTSRSIGNT